MARRGPTRRSAWVLLAAISLMCPPGARAQAWLAGRGEGAVSVTLGDYAFSGHFDSEGRRDPFGGTRAESVWVEVAYALTDRLGLSASLPFVTTKLTGGFPEGVALGPLDDGSYHGDFQDVRAEVAFMAKGGDLAITPFVGVSIPSHAYEIVGEAVPGKGIKEAIVGVMVGRTWAPALPRGYAHARYSYAVLEKVLPDVRSLNRSNLDVEVGYAATTRLAVRAAASGQVTHGGLDLEDMRTHASFFRDHDRAARTNFFNLGAGGTLSLASSWDVYLIFVKTIVGENAHQARSISAGATWRFGGRFGGAGP